MPDVGALDDYYLRLRASAQQHQDFQAIREQRERAKTLDEQRLLALEERRAFAREYARDNPVRGIISMLLLAPGEQAYKGAQHLRGREVGRSGFFAPLANIGAAYQGVAEGLVTRKRK